MLLAIDIGNTNIVIAGYSNNSWAHQWRLETEPDKSAEEYAGIIHTLFAGAEISYGDLNRIIISSVVPRLTGTIRSVFVKQTAIQPVILDGTTDTGISLDRTDPLSVGADLIADAAGAYHQFKQTCIIVDFGTATTLMVVKDPGVLAGGAICAGLKITRDALVEKAALLPQVPLNIPGHVIGADTIEAMQSGVVLGHICMVEGLIDRMKQTLKSAKVIATGGLATMLSTYSDYFDVVDPLLTLNGLRIIAERLGREQ